MWIDRVKEAKQKLGLSYQEIASRTSGKLSQRDVMRMIKGEYKRPNVEDVIELGAALNLSPRELFEEANLVVESIDTAQESSRISNENEKLLAEIEKLKNELEFKNALLTAKDEIIELYKRLNKEML